MKDLSYSVQGLKQGNANYSYQTVKIRVVGITVGHIIFRTDERFKLYYINRSITNMQITFHRNVIQNLKRNRA